MIKGNSLWTRVMNSKYFPNLSIEEWFRSPIKSSKGSILWKALVEAFPLVGTWTIWQKGNISKVRLGEDPWLGAGDNFTLSLPPPFGFLRENNLLSLKDVSIGSPQLRGCLGWKDATVQGLPEDLTEEWGSYVKLLCKNFISLDEESVDSLC
jgi:hypothetical protein